jgi:hypothetical protein
MFLVGVLLIVDQIPKNRNQQLLGEGKPVRSGIEENYDLISSYTSQK